MARCASNLLPTSLRWRLTAWVAGVMVLSAAVIFVVVYEETGARLRGQIDRSLAGNTGQLAELVSSLHGHTPHEVKQAAAAVEIECRREVSDLVLFCGFCGFCGAYLGVDPCPNYCSSAPAVGLGACSCVRC